MDLNDDEFLRGIQDAAKGLKVETTRDLVKLGLRVQNHARELCPVDTGRLRSSVIMTGPTEDGAGVYVEVGTNVEYGPHVEYGTQHSPAQPFLRPALLLASREGLRS